MLALSEASTAIEKANVEAQLPLGQILCLQAMTEEFQEAQLAMEPEEYLGVSEVAEMLHVSKQRVSELHGRPGFPEPIADLASGPVWRRSQLERFLAEWPRRPGRRRSATA
jgi:hypothetical protein